MVCIGAGSFSDFFFFFFWRHVIYPMSENKFVFIIHITHLSSNSLSLKV